METKKIFEIITQYEGNDGTATRRVVQAETAEEAIRKLPRLEKEEYVTVVRSLGEVDIL
jgi:hypothetical protein